MDECLLVVVNNRTLTDPLRNFYYSHMITTCVLVVLSFVAWFLRRDDPYLRHRDVWLLVISSAGLVMQVSTNPLVRAIGEPVPCLAYSVVQLLAFPLQAWPMTVRLLLWRARIRFNYTIASTVAKKGLYAMDTQSRSLLRARFPASRKFGFLLTFGVLGIYFLIVLLFSIFSTCQICDNAVTRGSNFTIYIVSAVLFICAATFLLLWYRDVPDPVAIRRESVIAWSLAAILGFPALIFQLVDLGGFREAEPVEFSWQIFIDLALLSFFLMAVPVQVFFSLHKERVIPRQDTSLDETLKKKTGYKYFQLYLATEFSMENLLFFKAYTDWKASYSETSVATMDHGRYLIEKFFTVGSALELNLSYQMRNAVLAHVNKATVPEDLFEAPAGVVHRYLEQSYEKFRRSDFYKLYTGKISPDEKGFVTSSGVSSFAVDDSDLDAEAFL